MARAMTDHLTLSAWRCDELAYAAIASSRSWSSSSAQGPLRRLTSSEYTSRFRQSLAVRPGSRRATLVQLMYERTRGSAVAAASQSSTPASARAVNVRQPDKFEPDVSMLVAVAAFSGLYTYLYGVPREGLDLPLKTMLGVGDDLSPRRGLCSLMWMPK